MIVLVFKYAELHLFRKQLTKNRKLSSIERESIANYVFQILKTKISKEILSQYKNNVYSVGTQHCAKIIFIRDSSQKILSASIFIKWDVIIPTQLSIMTVECIISLFFQIITQVNYKLDCNVSVPTFLVFACFHKTKDPDITVAWKLLIMMTKLAITCSIP